MSPRSKDVSQSIIGSVTSSQPPQSYSSSSLAETYAPATQALHADRHLDITSDVAPPLHVSTNFRYASDPDALVPLAEFDPTTSAHVYSRVATPNSARLEAVLGSLLHAPCVTYSSGLSALHAFYAHLRPRRVAITAGYHGSHGVLALHARLRGGSLEILPLDCPASALGPGDVVHVETPRNPTGEVTDIAAMAHKAHGRGAWLLVDGTLAPPGLQDPFPLGADVVWHSGTKYLGGHGDLLCGVLASRRADWVAAWRMERIVLGSVMGSLESWLVVRSLRTLSLRVKQQSASAEKLVTWLDGVLNGGGSGNQEDQEEAKAIRGTISRVYHASLQFRDPQAPSSKTPPLWLQRQMPHGFSPLFSILMHSPTHARRLPSHLNLFRHATSLGGVESLIEWRAMSDEGANLGLLRVSVGLEDWTDLQKDLGRGLVSLCREGTGPVRTKGKGTMESKL
ncbi:hypothetical protein MMC07_003199 [Pseudocyphellaria aurata]|nr:hypothetical protein [Pseudocyphellaria aurata]